MKSSNIVNNQHIKQLYFPIKKLLCGIGEIPQQFTAVATLPEDAHGSSKLSVILFPED